MDAQVVLVEVLLTLELPAQLLQVKEMLEVLVLLVRHMARVEVVAQVLSVQPT
jgi:hypothetical protein